MAIKVAAEPAVKLPTKRPRKSKGKPAKPDLSTSRAAAAVFTSTPPAPPAKVFKLSESKRAYGAAYMRDYRAGIRRRQLKPATAAV